MVEPRTRCGRAARSVLAADWLQDAIAVVLSCGDILVAATKDYRCRTDGWRSRKKALLSRGGALLLLVSERACTLLCGTLQAQGGA